MEVALAQSGIEPASPLANDAFRPRVAYTPRMTDTTSPDPTINDLQTAARELREAAGIIAPGNSNGRPLRDAPHLLRLTTPDGELAIRRWEQGTTADKIAFIATALDRARDGGLTTVPRVLPIAARNDATSLLLNGRLYTAATWQDGRPFSRYGGFRTPSGETIDIPVPQATPSEDVTLATARKLGKFHEATRGLAGDPRAPKAPLRIFLANTRRQWTHDRRVLGDKAAGSTEIRRWLRCGHRVMGAGADRLDAALSVLDDTSTIVHADLWPTHLLVSSSATPELTGITGWASLTTSSPVLDLAQLAVHTRGWSAANAEGLIGAYHDVAPLTPE